MRKLSNLNPQTVWSYFEDICQVPRPSKHEEKIIAYLLDFGKKHNLDTKRDAIGNVLISKPATKGMESKKTVVLQSHIDMVCEKNNDVEHDFMTDPIRPFVENGWVKAEGTTLGADDGIGIAAQMAILTDNAIEHGAIECLFTMDEETGLTGAFELKEGFFDGRVLINLDSEDEGELFIGCAGGIDTLATFTYEKEATPSGTKAYQIYISGLKGGHSGDEIDKGLGNANKILNRILWTASRKFGLRINTIDGGNKRNAVAREAKAIVTIPENNFADLQAFIDSFTKDVKNELAVTEPNLDICTKEVELPDFVIDTKTQTNLLNSVYACLHGVFEMSRSIAGLVETSTNLASIKFTEENSIVITTSQRSSVESAKTDIANMIESTFVLAGATVKHTDGYPGWNPNTDSEILRITEASYENVFGKKPIVRAIHAGLECGLFLEKYPDLDMISFGPTIKGAHSPDERIDIETTEKFWVLLLNVLKNTPNK